MKKHTLLVSGLSVVLLSACLKTRSQLREEEPESQPSSVSTSGPANQSYVVDELKSEIMRLTGKVEELERAQKTNPEEDKLVNEKLQLLDQRIAELEKTQAVMIERLQGVQEKMPKVESPELFSEGKALHESKNYEASLQKLEQYLKHPKAKFEEEATFLKAENLYQLKRYKEAIIEYSKFPEKYTRSKFMAKSLYQIGLSFESLGSKEDAKPFYQLLKEKYPKSSYTKRAMKRLGSK